ncbi:thermonuclease family protein [Jannaschia sp. Os4]|uniref:thermonuclease family protein n=1 Tax=Jannaschia sp. Os4 TaxID=2807617 RepID=UPI00193989FE|nr:thermonuclease family protein [Jannaschia sp. Os4]
MRLFGIDAPEMDQPYGQKAKWALVRLTKGLQVTVEPDGDPSYDRLVGRCTLPDGTDLSAMMVVEGMALDWAKYSGGIYRALEPEGARKRMWRVRAKHEGRFPPARDLAGATATRR